MTYSQLTILITAFQKLHFQPKTVSIYFELNNYIQIPSV